MKTKETQSERWDTVRTVTKQRHRSKKCNHTSKGRSHSPLVAIQPNGHQKPFFMVAGGHYPHAKHTVWGIQLAPYLSQDQPFYVLMARSFEGEKAPYRSVEAMAANCVEAIRSVQHEGPYCLGGQCRGGVLAFEIAQQLQKQGQMVSLLALLDTDKPVPPFKRYAHHFIQNCYSLKIFSRLGSLRPVRLETRFPYLFNQLRIAIMTLFIRKKNRVDQIEFARINYLSAIHCYKLKPYAGKIVYFACTERFYNHYEKLIQPWANLAKEGMEIYKFAGEHMNFIKFNTQLIGEQLQTCLEEAQAEPN